jgi:hypothetical protein
MLDLAGRRGHRRISTAKQETEKINKATEGTENTERKYKGMRGLQSSISASVFSVPSVANFPSFVETDPTALLSFPFSFSFPHGKIRANFYSN